MLPPPAIAIAIAIVAVLFFSSAVPFAPHDCLSWPPVVKSQVGHADPKNPGNGSFPFALQPNGSLPDASEAPLFGRGDGPSSSQDARVSVLERVGELRTRKDESSCGSSLKEGVFRILDAPSSTCCVYSPDGRERLHRKCQDSTRRHHLHGKTEKHSVVSGFRNIGCTKWQLGIDMENAVFRMCAMDYDDVASDETDAIGHNGYNKHVPGHDDVNSVIGRNDNCKDFISHDDDNGVIGQGLFSMEEVNLISDGEKEMQQHSCNDDANVNGLKEEGVNVVLTGHASEFLDETSSIIANFSTVHRRQEIDGGLYNYASDGKGAKILSSNKEAKGAWNILNKDKDKYFWSPCNAENKYVELELSEETLVVEVVIANYEFYSSNVRDFELLGSSVYPVKEWTLLGKFEAENSRVPQNFTLSEPKWTRYLRLQIISYYGSDFYCTLSVLEVHGVDAIEWLLAEWFAEEEGYSVNGKGDLPSNPLNEEMDSSEEDMTQLRVNMDEKRAWPMYQQTSRLALDAVMKLMMQKIRSLEHNQPHLHQIKELENQYADICNLYMNESSIMKDKLEEAAIEIEGVNALLRTMELKWYEEKQRLEGELLNHIRAWSAELDALRNEVKKAQDKKIVALTVALFSIVFITMIHIFKICRASLKMMACEQ